MAIFVSKAKQAEPKSLKKFLASIHLIVHWDGKIFKKISGPETINRLPIIVSGKGIDELQAVSKFQSGTGEA